MVEITNLWATISPYVMTGLTILSNIAIVLGFAVSIKRLVAKNDIKASEDRIASKVTEKVGNVSLTQNIQPIVESKMVEIEEKALDKMKEKMEEQNKQYLAMLKVLEGLAAYFDNSRGVPDEAKEKLKTAIEEAKTELKKDEEVKAKIIIEEPKKEVKKAENRVNTER